MGTGSHGKARPFDCCYSTHHDAVGQRENSGCPPVPSHISLNSPARAYSRINPQEMLKFREQLNGLANEYEVLLQTNHKILEENVIMREQLRQCRRAMDLHKDKLVNLDEIQMAMEADIEPPREFPLVNHPLGATARAHQQYTERDFTELEGLPKVSPHSKQNGLSTATPMSSYVPDDDGGCVFHSEDELSLKLEESASNDGKNVSPVPSLKGSDDGSKLSQFDKGKPKPLRSSTLGVLSRWFNPDSEEGRFGQSQTSSSGDLESLVLEKDNTPPDCGTIWPLGTFRLSWDFIAFLCLLVELWMTPFELVFLQDCETPLSLQATSWCITGFFVVDLFMNFNTGYIEGDTTVMQRRKIIKSYLQFWFWIDLVSTLPFDLLAETVFGNMFSIARVGKISKAMKILRYLKMVRAIRLIKTMKQASHLRKHFQILEPLRAVMQPIQVLIFLMLLAHIHGIAWGALQSEWVAVGTVSVALERYYRSFNWAFILLSVGVVEDASQESSAIWTLEMIMASERMSFIVLACRQVILHSLAYVDESQKAQTHKDLLTYFRRHQVSLQTQIQVMFSLTDVGSARKQQQYSSHLDDLPNQLAQVLRVELWSSRLCSMGLIKEVSGWHSEFINSLCQLATEKVLPSRCVLFHEGCAAVCSYYILDGELNANMSHDKTYIPSFKKGMWVGENAFVSPLLRYSATFSTKNISSFMVIRGSSFLQLVSQLGLMDRFEQFVSEELWKGLCGRCGSLGDHFSDKCPATYGHRVMVEDWRPADEDHARDPVGSSNANGFRKRSNSISSNASVTSLMSRASKASRNSSLMGKFGYGAREGTGLGEPEAHIHKTMGRGLRRLLQEWDLERLTPTLLSMNIQDLDDLGKLNVEELRLMLPSELRLTMEQEQGLSPEYVKAFKEKSARRVRNTLFRAVSRLHHLMFLSHYKLEAGTEAALMRTELEQAISEDAGSPGHYFDDPVFLDSDNLKNLTDLQQRVKNSHNLVFLCTAGVLSRPWCLVEIVTAKRTGVRIIPVTVSKPGGTFGFPDESFYENLRNGTFLDKGATETLAECNCSLSDVEDAIRCVFQHIALPYSPHKGRNIRRAEVETLLKQCRLKDEADGVMDSQAIASQTVTGFTVAA